MSSRIVVCGRRTRNGSTRGSGRDWRRRLGAVHRMRGRTGQHRPRIDVAGQRPSRWRNGPGRSWVLGAIAHVLGRALVRRVAASITTYGDALGIIGGRHTEARVQRADLRELLWGELLLRKLRLFEQLRGQWSSSWGT